MDEKTTTKNIKVNIHVNMYIQTNNISINTIHHVLYEYNYSGYKQNNLKSQIKPFFAHKLPVYYIIVWGCCLINLHCEPKANCIAYCVFFAP